MRTKSFQTISHHPDTQSRTLVVLLRAITILYYGIKAAVSLPMAFVWARHLDRKPIFDIYLGKCLKTLLEDLGPTFVKIGQLLSTRRDLFSPEVLSHLCLLQDSTAPCSYEHLRNSFKRDFHVEIDAVIPQVDKVPIASASIASVFRGKMKNGRPVAVKIRKPGISRIIDQDLRIVAFLTNSISWLPVLRNIPLTETIGALSTTLRRQVHFKIEAYANKRLTQTLKMETDIRLPVLLTDYCSNSILTMEYFESVSESRSEQGLNKACALANGLKALYRMIFLEGFVHCDMHPGNFHLFDDGKVILLDFGLIAELRDEHRIAFAEFFYAMVVNDGYSCTQITLETAYRVPKNLNYDAFSEEIIKLIDKYSGRKVTGFQVSGFVSGMFDIQRKYKVRGTSAFIMAIISLLVFEGVAKTVDPELDFQVHSIPYLQKALNMRRTVQA